MTTGAGAPGAGFDGENLVGRRHIAGERRAPSFIGYMRDADAIDESGAFGVRGARAGPRGNNRRQVIGERSAGQPMERPGAGVHQVALHHGDSYSKALVYVSRFGLRCGQSLRPRGKVEEHRRSGCEDSGRHQQLDQGETARASRVVHGYWSLRVLSPTRSVSWPLRTLHGLLPRRASAATVVTRTDRISVRAGDSGSGWTAQRRMNIEFPGGVAPLPSQRPWSSR